MTTELLLRLTLMHQARLLAYLWDIAEPHATPEQAQRVSEQNDCILAHLALDARNGERLN